MLDTVIVIVITGPFGVCNFGFSVGLLEGVANLVIVLSSCFYRCWQRIEVLLNRLCQRTHLLLPRVPVVVHQFHHESPEGVVSHFRHEVLVGVEQGGREVVQLGKVVEDSPIVSVDLGRLRRFGLVLHFWVCPLLLLVDQLREDDPVLANLVKGVLPLSCQAIQEVDTD